MGTGQGVCDTESGTCTTPGASRPGQIYCPGCGQSPCRSPYDCGTAMWGCSFFQAMKEVQIELLKPKIQKAWGPMMEKAADGILKSMESCWQSMVAQTEAKEDFKELLRSLWTQGKK